MPPKSRGSASPGDGKSAAGSRSGKSPARRARTSASKTPPAPNPEPPEPPKPPPKDSFGRWTQAAPTDTADLASYYGRLITVSSTRVGLLGDLLADEYEKHKLNALRRITYTPAPDGGAEPSGEVPTALARLEADERRTLERLLVKAAELGISLRTAAAREQRAAEQLALLFAFAERAGLDHQAPEVRRWMQLAALDSRMQTEQRQT